MDKLSSYLSLDLIKLHLNANTKEEMLKEMALLVKDKVSDFDKFYEALLDRESAGSTAMENGLCIPHTRNSYVKEFCIAVGTKEEGIECNSIDGKKSTVFFLIISNDKTKLEHLDALVKISRVVNDEIATMVLSSTKSKEGFIELIKKLELRWQFYCHFF